MDGANDVFAISCPSRDFCLAGDLSGNLLYSTHPTSATPTWDSTNVSGLVSGGAGLEGIQCPSVKACYALADSLEYSGGDILASSSPEGGPMAWTSVYSDPNALANISCPSTTECVASDDDVNVVASSQPSEPGSWSVVSQFAGYYPSAGLSCSTDVCAISRSDGYLQVSTDPTGGSSDWDSIQLSGASLSGIGCAATTCVASDGPGFLSSMEPTGGAGAWSLTAPEVDGYDSLSGATCANAHLCAFVDSSGSLLISEDPSGGPSKWTVVDLDSHPLGWAGCPSASLCLAADAWGNEFSSATPTSPASWAESAVDSAGFTTFACPYVSLCLATDSETRSSVNTTPPDGWSTPNPIQPNTFANVAAACASTLRCAFASRAGYVDATSNAPSNDFTPTKVPGYPDGISCPSADLCVAVDYAGQVLTSENPFSASPEWSVTATPSPDALSAVDCTSVTMCVAVDEDGNAYVSTTPRGPSSDWTAQDIDGTYDLSSIWCGKQAGICLATDTAGRTVFGEIG